MKLLKIFILVFLLFNYQSGMSQEISIATTKLSDQVYMLVGQGGNIGISIGDDGVFIIDDQFAKITPKITKAIRALSEKPLCF